MFEARRKRDEAEPTGLAIDSRVSIIVIPIRKTTQRVHVMSKIIFEARCKREEAEPTGVATDSRASIIVIPMLETTYQCKQVFMPCRGSYLKLAASVMKRSRHA